MAFQDYESFVEPLRLPIRGKVYEIPALGMAEGLKFSEVIDGGQNLTDLPDEQFRRMFLGTAYDEMIADNLPANAVARAALTALADYSSGREVAQVMWETGGDPKALTAWVAAQQNRAQRRSTSTAVAKKTPSQASTTTTSSRKK